jgi:GntR family transcriptional regulator
MLLKIEFEKETPIYEQLRNQIVHGIATGELKEGESMPSVRQLAADLGINLHTVNKTYNILKNEGFLTVHRRKSVIVNSREAIQKVDISEKLDEKLRPLIAEAVCRGMDRADLEKIVGNIHATIKNDKETR